MRSNNTGVLVLALCLVCLPLRAETDGREAIKTWVHDVTIFEGGETNDGWADYRDNHIGQELKEFENLAFSHSNVVPHFLGDGRSAYVTAEYRLRARIAGKDVDASGLETLVLVKDDGGEWKIRHAHTSSNRMAAQAPPSAPSRP